MVDKEGKIDLISTLHSNKRYQKRFDGLIGLDKEKDDLIFGLRLILDQPWVNSWKEKHHKNGLPFLERFTSGAPLAILYGDVGCGKTELAISVGTPLSKQMGGETVRVFETPTDIRAGGFVGDISKRIVATFDDAKSKLKQKEFGILIIDEADDLATSREQMQAHHEDRAGVNVLIKEIDAIEREGLKLAVILITNRNDALDPAVRRRASLQIGFSRPNEDAIKQLLKTILDGIKVSDKSFNALVDECKSKKPGFTSSDIIRRIGENTIAQCIKSDTPLSAELLLQIIQKTTPSPEIS